MNGELGCIFMEFLLMLGHKIFFRLCVLDTGRFIRSDECTVDKARLDFARVLISTPHIEIANTTAAFLIDNCNYTVKLVEEWGCNLGEDAFMTEEVIDSRPETLSNPSNVNDLDMVQGEWEFDSNTKQNLCQNQQTNCNTLLPKSN